MDNKVKKSYEKPEIKSHGKLKDATLGGAGSGGDALDFRE